MVDLSLVDDTFPRTALCRVLLKIIVTRIADLQNYCVGEHVAIRILKVKYNNKRYTGYMQTDRDDLLDMKIG